MKKLVFSMLMAGFALSAVATDYTWTGGAEGDGQNWYNPTNWGKTAVNDYPKSTSDKAIIPANADMTVAITNDIKIHTLTLNSGCSFTLKGAAEGGALPQLVLSSGFTDNGVKKFKLDHVYFYRNAGWTPKAGCSFELVNGAKLYLANFSLSAMDSVSLADGSWMSVNEFLINGKARTLTIDDSVFESRSHCYLGTTNPGGGHIVFKGAHPIFRVLSGECRSNNNNAGMTDMFDLDFEVPEGGFAEVPMQLYGNMFSYNQGNVPNGYFRFNVLASSPAVAAGSNLDFCALLSTKGIYRTKVSTADAATATLRLTDDARAENPASDATARMLYLTLAGANTRAPSVHPAALALTSQAVATRNSLTVTGWLTALATDGSNAQLQLWVGESNSTAAMTLADSVEASALGATSLTFAAPEDIGEKTYYFQLRLTRGAGDPVVTPVISAMTKDETTYTWRAVEGDWSGEWSDPAHWTADYATADGYPHTANTTVKFPRGHEIVVTIGDNTTVGTLDLSDYNPDDAADAIDVTFKGAEGEENGTNKVLKASTFNVGTPFGQVTVDRVKMNLPTFALGTGRTLRLQNAAFVTTGAIDHKYGGAIEVLSESTLDMNGSLNVNTAESTVRINDATIAMRGGSVYLAQQNVNIYGGLFVFEGSHPRLTFEKDRYVDLNSNSSSNRSDFRFVIPKGGYERPPISCVATQTKKFAQSNGRNYQNFYLSVDPASGCYEAEGEFTQVLADWPGTSAGIVETTCLRYVDLPDGGAFSVPDEHQLAVHVVSAAHPNRATVSGDAGVTIDGALPAFGEIELAGATVFSSPAVSELDGVRYTCSGCTVTEIEKTAAGSVHTSNEYTGNVFSFTPSGKEVEVVWHYTRDYKVTAAALNDANGMVSASNEGYASATEPVTLTAATTSEDMEFQYWYGDVPYAQRYTNPLTVSGDKARSITAFFGRKAGGICRASGSNGTVQWYDANQWAEKVIPGTNDTAVVWSTRTDTQAAQYKRYYQVPSFFAVKNLIASNACILVNGSTSGNWPSAKFDEQGGTYTYRPILVADANRLEPVGCDIFGDVTLDCYKATAQNNGAILYVGGQNQQCYSKVNIYGNLTVTDGSVEVAAGYPIPAMIDATKAIDGPNGFLPFTHLEEFFRGGNVLKVHGKTTLRSPIGMASLSTIHVMNEFRTGAAVWLDLQNVEVQNGAEITANYGGYGKFDATGAASGRSDSMCPGGHCAGDNTSGGSYGGAGGSEDTSYPVQKPTTHMATYGYETAPFYPGGSSGGDGGCDGRGGGSIRLDCKTLDLDGGLLAQAKFSTGNSNKGGAAGGGIWFVCEEFNPGLDCIIKAEGGNSSGPNAGGGGGRVAICEGLTAEQVLELFETEDHLATDATVSSLADKLGARLSVAGGTGTTSRSNGYPGTGVYIVNTAGKKTMTVMGDPVNMGEPTPGYGPQVFEQNQVIELAGPEDAYVSDDNRSRRNCVGYTITDANGDELVDSDERTGSYKITQDCILTWKLTALVHKLETVVSEGGSITTNAIAAADEAWQPDGSTITLTAVPSEGRVFAGWYGELPTNLQATATISFPSAKGRTVKALFVTTAEGPVVWTGAGDGTSWDDAANWDIGAVPGAKSAVTIPEGASVVAAMCVPIKVASLTVDAGATLKVTPNGAYSTYDQPQVAEKSVETDWQPIALHVAGDLMVNGTFEIGGKFSLATVDLAVGGRLVFGEGARGAFYAAYRASDAFLSNPRSRYDNDQTSMELAANHAVGGQVTVAGEFSVATNAVVSPWCDFVSGAAVRFDVGSLRVAAGGKIDADGKGWGYVAYSGVAYSFCPTLLDGNTGGYAGGTHAGMGGYSDQHTPSFKVYGWAYAPILPGGPGYNTSQAPGGGVVRIHADGTIRCYGTITAVGGTGNGYHGAGGGIFLTGSRYRSADTTVVSAAGHDNTAASSPGAGAGGRVAIALRLSASDLAALSATGTCEGLANGKVVATDLVEGLPAGIKGTISARGGVNNRTYIADRRYSGEDGTVYLLEGPKSGLSLIVR